MSLLQPVRLSVQCSTASMEETDCQVLNPIPPIHCHTSIAEIYLSLVFCFNSYDVIKLGIYNSIYTTVLYTRMLSLSLTLPSGHVGSLPIRIDVSELSQDRNTIILFFTGSGNSQLSISLNIEIPGN